MHNEIVELTAIGTVEARSINELIEELDKLKKDWSSEAIKHNSSDATHGAGRP